MSDHNRSSSRYMHFNTTAVVVDRVSYLRCLREVGCQRDSRGNQGAVRELHHTQCRMGDTSAILQQQALPAIIFAGLITSHLDLVFFI